jgi:hypothetical protein
MPIGMDLWYPLISESTDLQQAAELNSTRNVKVSDVNFNIFFNLSLRTMQLTKKSTCPTKFFSCPKKINKNYKNQRIIISNLCKMFWLLSHSIHIIRLPFWWACYSRTKLRNWWLDTHVMMTSFDTNDFVYANLSIKVVIIIMSLSINNDRMRWLLDTTNVHV